METQRSHLDSRLSSGLRSDAASSSCHAGAAGLAIAIFHEQRPQRKVFDLDDLRAWLFVCCHLSIVLPLSAALPCCPNILRHWSDLTVVLFTSTSVSSLPGQLNLNLSNCSGMDLAPLLLAGVRDAGSAQLDDRQFRSLLSHADDVIQASLQPSQHSIEQSSGELSQVPGETITANCEGLQNHPLVVSLLAYAHFLDFSIPMLCCLLQRAWMAHSIRVVRPASVRCSYRRRRKTVPTAISGQQPRSTHISFDCLCCVLIPYPCCY